MSIYRHPKSPFYNYEFEIGGHRHRGSTEKRSKREAEAVEREIKARLRAEHRASSAPRFSLHARRWQCRYVHETGAGQEIERQLARCLPFLGADKRMADVTGDHIAKLVSWLSGRRKWDRDDMPLLSAATVNRTGVELLRRVFSRARKKWGARFPNEPKWQDYRIDEPEERARELHGSEREAIELAMRPDGYVDVVGFALASGFRMEECLLRWSEVNWRGRVIEKTGKWGKKIRTRITPGVEDILRPLIGRHPIYVFTYVARHTTGGRMRGCHYPVTYEGLKIEWRRTLARSVVSDLRFHDLRHDFGTRVQRACGNIKITQRALNHSRIESTLRYINVRDDEVTAALEAAQTPHTTSPVPRAKQAKYLRGNRMRDERTMVREQGVGSSNLPTPTHSFAI
jgi:integrase